MLNLRVISAASATTLLVACGGADPDIAPRDNTVSASEADDVSKGSPKAKTTSKIKHPIVDKSRKGLTFDGYLGLEVQGLKPLMTISEVRATLAERGYDIGAASRFGMRCDPCRIGRSQDRAPTITRSDGPQDKSLEEVTPFFFVDSDGEQRLWGLIYKRGFDTPTDPPKMKAPLEERFGEATRNWAERIDADDPSTMRQTLDYDLVMLLPNGETIDDTEQDKLARLRLNTNGRTIPQSDSRAECWKSKLETGDMPATPWCSYILALDERPTDWFFGARYNQDVLNVDVGSDR